MSTKRRKISEPFAPASKDVAPQRCGPLDASQCSEPTHSIGKRDASKTNSSPGPVPIRRKLSKATDASFYDSTDQSVPDTKPFEDDNDNSGSAGEGDDVERRECAFDDDGGEVVRMSWSEARKSLRS